MFAAVAVVHLVAQLTLGDALFTDTTQAMLMPLLAAGVAWWPTVPRTRLVRLTVVALSLSWLGDAVPDFVDGDAAFLVMVGFFLCAQLVYIAAFVPYRRGCVWFTHRWVVGVYALAVVALVAMCAATAGPLLIPVTIYATCIATMAILATGVSRVTTVGAILFVVSDALIALGAFVDDIALPASGFWVMATYIAAQACLARGALGAPDISRV